MEQEWEFEALKDTYAAILKRPTVFIGSCERETVMDWSVKDGKMVYGQLTYTPGLVNVISEGVANAADNRFRNPPMTKIRINVDPEKKQVKITNDGFSIPIRSEKGFFIPECLFSRLWSGSNYNDEKKKLLSGQNGLGAKAMNMFSTKFTAQVVNSGQKYRQTWKTNMKIVGDKKITDSKESDSVTVQFTPDLERFKYEIFEEDFMQVMQHRIFYTTATLPKSIAVYYNGKRVLKSTDSKTSWVSYCKMVDPDIAIHESDRWKVGFAYRKEGGSNLTFVNGLRTMRGGTHEKYIHSLILSKISEHLKKKLKGKRLNTSLIKRRTVLVLSATVENPRFDGQAKDKLITKHTDFGSVCTLDDRFIKKILKSGIVADLLDYYKNKKEKEDRTTDGKMKKSVFIKKLIDPGWAGTKRREHARLFLSEGDSGNLFVEAGLTVVGTDKYGAFPLRGKFINAFRHENVHGNTEVQAIKKAMGLFKGCKVSDLRIGGIIFACDSDPDAFHIKALLYSFFYNEHPELLKDPNFLMDLWTPLKRGIPLNSKAKALCTDGPYIEFIFDRDFKKFLETKDPEAKFEFIHIKGLAGHDNDDAKRIFSNLDRYLKRYEPPSEDDIKLLKIAMDKNSDGRKEWSSEKVTAELPDLPTINVSEFINCQVKLAAENQNERSIPRLDGWKPTQKKIITTLDLIKNWPKRIKLMALSGKVAETAHYGAGDASLMEVEATLAKKRVGSFNVNILIPYGQFGNRRNKNSCGKLRYLHTALDPIIWDLIPREDFPVTKRVSEDNEQAEYEMLYSPIPTLLLNGCNNIGFGHRTFILPRNPYALVEWTSNWLNGIESEIPPPWMRGFNGDIYKGEKKNSWHIDGKIEKDRDGVFKISELPLNLFYLNPYKEFLEKLRKEKIIDSFTEGHSEWKVCFRIKAHNLEWNEDNLKTIFKLKSLHKEDPVVYNENDIIETMDLDDAARRYCKLRLDKYEERKLYMIPILKEKVDFIYEKIRFYEMVLGGDIHIVKKGGIKKKQLIETIESLNFRMKNDCYDYLMSGQLWSLTCEKVASLRLQAENIEKEYKKLQTVDPKDIWRGDLDRLKNSLAKNWVANPERTENKKKKRKPETVLNMFSKIQKI
jgi:DNA topoisomerase-2